MTGGTVSTWAHLDASGVVTNVSVGDAEWGSSQGLTCLDGIDPQPGIGWTLANGTWTAPAPPALTPEQQAKQQAIATLQDFSAQQPTVAAQLEADIATVTGTGWDTLTTADRQAIVARMLNGFGTLMTAVQACITATGTR